MTRIILLLQCKDEKGLLARIVDYFYSNGFNILHCQQHTDSYEGMYYMRLELDASDLKTSRSEFEKNFSNFASSFKFKYSISFTDIKKRVAILVSRTSHCLYELLSRNIEGELDCEIPLIISNHKNLEKVAQQFRIPYYYFPVEEGHKEEQEEKVRAVLRKFDIDLVILARYMQILSKEFTEEFPIINIHHAFLPAFQGANPYLRAYKRGVKMIGATAHYATEDLDKGPIIEQDVVRVSHLLSPEGLKEVGRDVEKQVLARAVEAHLEERIIVNGNRTIVFSKEF